MKTLKIILLFSLTLGFVACKKDKKPAQEMVLGKWNLVSWVTETTNPPNPTRTESEIIQQGDYFDFRSDGKFSYKMGEDDGEYPYSVTGESSINIDEELFTIKELSKNRFVFEQVTESGTRTQRLTITLSR